MKTVKTFLFFFRFRVLFVHLIPCGSLVVLVKIIHLFKKKLTSQILFDRLKLNDCNYAKPWDYLRFFKDIKEKFTIPVMYFIGDIIFDRFYEAVINKNKNFKIKFIYWQRKRDLEIFSFWIFSPKSKSETSS